MREIWLRPNRRAIWFGCLPPLAIAALGAWLAASAAGAAVWLGAFLILVGLTLVGLLLLQLFRPRVAYRDAHVLFYLCRSRPIAVPVGIVEAFFVGRGPAPLPGALKRQQTMNLVARIAQREMDWARRDVKASLGNWCDGYVTIRGTWCEPLEPELIRRLNRRLKEVKTEIALDRRATS